MKAKDIALLCTAAAGAGAAAGSVISGAGRSSRKTVSTAQKKAPAKKADSRRSAISPKAASANKNEPTSHAELKEICGLAGKIEKLSCENDCGILTVITAEENSHRAFAVKDGKASEVRCPLGVIHMASDNDCTAFLTSKGCIFVYNDPEREPVLCPITAPEYICAVKGVFCIFSDSLMYVCSQDGNIVKTVSLGAMIEITDSDICDAENSDDNFASLAVKIKKAYLLGDTHYMAVLTADGRSFLADCLTEGFSDIEKTYTDIIDVCSCGGFAYYLYSAPAGYGLIKTRISDENIITEAKYSLCGKDEEPIKLISFDCGLAVMYKNGKVKTLLPEISDAAEKDRCRSGLRALNNILEALSVSDLVTLNEKAAVLSGGRISYAEIQADR